MTDPTDTITIRRAEYDYTREKLDNALATIADLRRDLEDAGRTIQGLRLHNDQLRDERDEYRDALLGRHTVRTAEMARKGRAA